LSVLYVVATPIGNLKDITFRAVETLKEVDYIAAEDTRKARILLKTYLIEKPLISYHKDNEEKSSQHLINLILKGHSIALISEAGTPGISDPGYPLLQKAKENHIDIIPIPGVSAVITALSVSTLPTDKFLFIGFLPMKKGKKRKILELYKDLQIPVVLYESPYRIVQTLELIKEIFGNIEIFIGRELTKLYEEKLIASTEEMIEIFSQKKAKGEFVIILNLKKESGT